MRIISEFDVRDMMTVHPLQGIGMLEFGMPTLGVERLIEKPSESDMRIFEDPTNFEEVALCFHREWRYSDLGLVLSFSSKTDSEFDLRLSQIDVTHKHTSIFGREPIGVQESSLIEMFRYGQLSDLQLKSNIRLLDPGNPEFDMCEYFSKNNQISFWVEQDIVVNMTLWPPWKPNEWIKEQPDEKQDFF